MTSPASLSASNPGLVCPPLWVESTGSESAIANKRRNCYTGSVDEGRKRVLLIAASILAARKLAQYDSGARVPATVAAIAECDQVG